MTITAAFTSAVDSTIFNSITVVEIALDGGSEFYSDKAISGQPTILPYITKPISQNPAKISAKRASSSYSSMRVSLLDKDDEITNSIKDEAWINKIMKVYAFYDGLTWPTDRVLLFTGYITEYNSPSSGTEWVITANEVREQSTQPLFLNETTLKTAITTVGQTTGIEVNDPTQIYSSGTLRVNDEYISYASLSGDELVGVSRGVSGSTAATHAVGDSCTNLVTISDDPINIMLQLLLSINGDGANDATYDVLPDGIGLNPADVDKTTFETIRDTNAFGTYTFNIDSTIDNAMRFIEQELQTPTNTRMMTTFEGQLSLTELGVVTFGSATETVTEDEVIGTPQMRITTRDIINQLKISYGYNSITRQFTSVTEASDATSISTYGQASNSRKSFQFKGINTDSIITSFYTDYFKRNSTPVPDIKVTTFLKKRILDPGDVVELQARNLPNLTLGNRNFNAQLELMEARYAPDRVTMALSYTNFQPGRLAYIAPARAIDSKTSETVFDLTTGSGARFEEGWRVILYDVSTNTVASTYRTITDITGDQVTIDTAFSVTIKTDGTHYLRFPDYNDATNGQHLYAFISTTGGGDFADGTETYRIQE